jgi:hypothetical protein
MVVKCRTPGTAYAYTSAMVSFSYRLSAGYTLEHRMPDARPAIRRLRAT